MEKYDKIKLMCKRIDFFYRERRLDARKRHRNDNLYKDYASFCDQAYEIADYCFYLGEYCKFNRKWLADYSRWEVFKTNDLIIEKMCLLMRALIFEIELEHQVQGNKRLNIIYHILENNIQQYVGSHVIPDEENARKYLVYSFMGGLMDVDNSVIDNYWKAQYGLIERREKSLKKLNKLIDSSDGSQNEVIDEKSYEDEMGTIISDNGKEVISEYEYYDEDGKPHKERKVTYYPFRPYKYDRGAIINPEDRVMNALMNGNGEVLGF